MICGLPVGYFEEGKIQVCIGALKFYCDNDAFLYKLHQKSTLKNLKNIR